jgi:hypothetical protein
VTSCPPVAGAAKSHKKWQEDLPDLISNVHYRSPAFMLSIEAISSWFEMRTVIRVAPNSTGIQIA